MKLTHLMSAVALAWLIPTATSTAFGQSNPRYIRFAGVPSAVKGALFTPDVPQPAPRVGILVMHRASNFMNTLACPELSKRGFLYGSVHESPLRQQRGGSSMGDDPHRC